MKLLIFFTFFIYITLPDPKCCQSTKFKIIDSPELNLALKTVTDSFLQRVAHPKFDRLSSTILLPTNDPNVYLRGSIRGTEVAYPAR